jgi:hypothetical protein
VRKTRNGESMKKIELMELWDDEHENLGSDFETIFDVCKSCFLSDKFTIQQYTFACMMSFDKEYTKVYETLPNIEKFKIDFLAWQNTPLPEILFNEKDDTPILKFSHNDDQTWNSLDLWIRSFVNNLFSNSFQPYRPMTQERQSRYEALVNLRQENKK